MPLYSAGVPAGTDPVNRASIFAEIREHSQIVSVANTTARAALLTSLAGQSPAITPTAASPVFVYRQDTGDIEVTTNGSTWRVYSAAGSTFRIATGWTTLSFSATNSAAQVITFPAGRFTAAPGIVASPTTFNYGISALGAEAETATQFTLRALLQAPVTGSIGVRWVAVQMAA